MLTRLWIIVWCAVTSFTLHGQPVAAKEVVALVNQVPVYKDEFMWRMTGLRSACYDYFIQKYVVQNTAAFWHQSFNGECPLEWIKQKTLAQIREDRGKLAVMQRYGVLKGFCFEQFQQACSRENEKRKWLAANQSVVYGMVNMDAYTLYEYILSNALQETKRRMLALEPPPADTLKKLYEQLKEEQFHLVPTISVAYTSITGERDSITQTLTFNPAYSKSDELEWGSVYTQSMRLKKTGERSLVFKNAGGQDCFVTCTAFHDNGYLPFEQLTGNLQSLYAEAIFDAWVKASLAHEAIAINRQGWDALTME